MGNTVIKDEGDFIEETDNSYTSDIELDSVHLQENLRSSATSTPSDLSFSLEDAVSVNTDSTNTADYESANENDVSNRMSTGTEIFYDIPANVNSPIKTDKSESIVKTEEEEKVGCSPTLENTVFERLFSTVPANNNEDLFNNEEDNEHDSMENLHGEIRPQGDLLEYPKMQPQKPKNGKHGFDVVCSSSPVTYNDILVLNYEHVFEEKAKREHASGTRSASNFDQVGNVLSGALDKISTLLETTLSKEEKEDDDFNLTECIRIDTLLRHNVIQNDILYNVSILNSLNKRACYLGFFEFNYRNVFVSRDEAAYKLNEAMVKQFFSNRFIYLFHLENMRFLMKSHLRDLCYMADISDISERSLLQLYTIIDHTEVMSNVKDEKGGEKCSDYLFPNSDENELFISDFSSLQSEIIDCAFQLNSIDSEVMNCNENVSEAGPATAADIDSVNNVPSKFGGTGAVSEELRKQSLYMKFDPLIANDINSSANNDDTLKLNNSYNSKDELLDNSKIENKILEDKNVSNEVTDSKVNENGGIGKLISVTPTKSPRRNTPKSSPRFSETDPDDVSKLQSLLLKQMKKEESFKEEIETLRRENEQVLRKLQGSEEEVTKFKALLEAVQENEKKLKNELKERIKSKQQLSSVMEEYEKTISQMLNKREDEKKEFETAIKKVEAERDSTMHHLNNLENAFNDIHQKYERGKSVTEALKKNEDSLKRSISEYESTVKTVENKYELLKSHATSQLEKANQELELITQSYEKEQAKLKALLKKSEIQINSLQNALDRKTKENQELAAICDELIIKLSTHSNA